MQGKGIRLSFRSLCQGTDCDRAFLLAMAPQKDGMIALCGSWEAGERLKMELEELAPGQEGPCLQDKLRSLDSMLSIMYVCVGVGGGEWVGIRHGQLWFL